MPWSLWRFHESDALHFITTSCYRRKPLLGTPNARNVFLTSLEKVRGFYAMRIFGYVVMPEHVHMIVSEPEKARLSLAMQLLKQTVARELRQTHKFPAFWTERYYDFNVRTQGKLIEKLRYLHRNPVARELCTKPEDWEWSSFRHYATGEMSVVEVESQWTARKRELAGEFPRVKVKTPALSPKPGDKDGAPTAADYEI